MAVNLHLVIVCGINTSGYNKWYILGSTTAATITVVPGGAPFIAPLLAVMLDSCCSAVKGVWGWDTLSTACWITVTERHARIAWSVSSHTRRTSSQHSWPSCVRPLSSGACSRCGHACVISFGCGVNRNPSTHAGTSCAVSRCELFGIPLYSVRGAPVIAGTSHQYGMQLWSIR